MDAAAKRLAGFKQFLHYLASVLHADFSVIVWDGDIIPLKTKPTDDLAIRIADEGVLATLVRSPRAMTLVDLVACGRVMLVNGTLLDMEPRRQALEDARVLSKISKWRAIQALAPFLMAPRGEMKTAGRRPDLGEGGDDTSNIQFHYDVSNDFYKLFLDPTMAYSSAYYPTWDSSLDAAQEAKLDIICRKLRLEPEERFLDVGCGWGSLILHAAQHYGVKAHGLTLSQKQFDYVQAKVAALGLQNRVTVKLENFRAATGEYDKIASIEMSEHVGAQNLLGYYEKMASLLRVRGLFLHQASARRARPEHLYRRQTMTRAMTKHIFPGGYLESIGGTLANMEKAEFDIHDVESLREHFALTCREWTRRLYARREEAAALVGEAQTHLWLNYLARSAIGFDRGAMAVFQTLASKRARGASGLPPTRAGLYAADRRA